MVLYVFISLLGGVPLCIPYGLYSGTSLGGTTRGTLEGYPGRVLSAWYQSSRFLIPWGCTLLCNSSSVLYTFLTLSLKLIMFHLFLEYSSSSGWHLEVVYRLQTVE